MPSTSVLRAGRQAVLSEPRRPGIRVSCDEGPGRLSISHLRSITQRGRCLVNPPSHGPARPLRSARGCGRLSGSRGPAGRARSRRSGSACPHVAASPFGAVPCQSANRRTPRVVAGGGADGASGTGACARAMRAGKSGGIGGTSCGLGRRRVGARGSQRARAHRCYGGGMLWRAASRGASHLGATVHGFLSRCRHVSLHAPAHGHHERFLRRHRAATERHGT